MESQEKHPDDFHRLLEAFFIEASGQGAHDAQCLQSVVLGGRCAMLDVVGDMVHEMVHVGLNFLMPTILKEVGQTAQPTRSHPPHRIPEGIHDDGKHAVEICLLVFGSQVP